MGVTLVLRLGFACLSYIASHCFVNQNQGCDAIAKTLSLMYLLKIEDRYSLRAVDFVAQQIPQAAVALAHQCVAVLSAM